MNCCGDHVDSFPRPDDLTLSISCSEILKEGEREGDA